METVFKNWKIDGYKAVSNDGRYNLWIANGFFFFEDIDAHFPREPLLKGVNILTRYKIWRELCRERSLRAKSFYESLSK